VPFLSVPEVLTISIRVIKMQRSNLNLRLVIPTVLLAMGTTAAGAATRYVPSPYSTIQSAINACNNGDVVIVADGTYTGTGNRDIDFLGKAITVRSENGPGNCIVDCQQLGIGFSLATNSVVDGFTVTNGNTGIIVSNNTTGSIITNCRIIENKGVGIFFGYLTGGETLQISNSSISRNLGNGIDAATGHVEVSGCEISENTGNGVQGHVANGHSFSNCNIIGNSGRGLALGYRVAVDNCYIGDNLGGGVSIYYPTYSEGPTIANTVISGNSAGDGAGIYIHWGMYFSLTNCTISGNSASNRGGGICFNELDIRDEAAIITDCLFWDNTALGDGDEIAILYDRAPASIPVRVSYTDILRGPENIYEEPGNAFLEWGEGNIDADPCFADPGCWDANGTPEDANDDFWVAGDYHLKSQGGRYDAYEGGWTTDDVTSLCIDAGDPNRPIGFEVFPNGGLINMGAYGGTAEASKSYFGKPPCETIVAGDINGDCIVDFRDFRLMGMHWLEEH